MTNSYDTLVREFNNLMISTDITETQIYPYLIELKDKIIQTIKDNKRLRNRIDIKFFRSSRKNDILHEIDSLNSLIMNINVVLDLYDPTVSLEERHSPSQNTSYILKSMKNWGPCDRHEVEDNTCGICYENLNLSDNVKHLGVNHYFHESCLLQWYKDKKTCPVCRGAFGKTKRKRTKSSKRPIKSTKSTKSRMRSVKSKRIKY